MWSLSLLLLCANALAAVPHMQKRIYSEEPHKLKQYFEEFIVTHGKQYAHEEEKNYRFEIFKENVAEINKRNSDPKETAIFAINKFADLTAEEFKERYMGFEVSLKRGTISYENISRYVDVPDEHDWRTKNVVTRVKNQRGCGSCWAFSSVGCIESSYAIRHKSILELSEQQLVSCDRDQNAGCAGGLMQFAIQYVVDAGGIEGESDYPYTATNGTCTFDKSKIKAKVSKMLPYKLNNEADTKQFLLQNGPVAIALDASYFFGYSGGILQSCPDNLISHAVLLVGYGIEKNTGRKYWIIKNSWGTDWGEDGYIRIAYKEGYNPCGMYNEDAAGAEVA